MSVFKTSDGVQLYFEDWGQGRPLVFVHGWPLSAAMWEYQTVPLAAAGFRCIAYDRRGFGRSDKPYGGYDYGRLGLDLAELIEHLDLSDATLVGFSMGGGEVADNLTRHNDKGRVTRAMLVSSIIPYMSKTPDNPDGVDAPTINEILLGLTNDRPAFLTTFIEQFFGVGLITSPVSEPILATSRDIAMQASPVATLECVKSFALTDFRSVVPSIKVPVLVIHGNGDQTVPIAATAKRAAELIPGAELKIYSGAPHGLYYTNRHELTRDIAAFASEGRVVIGASA